MSEKQREEKLLHDIQLVSGLKARLGGKKADGTALIMTTQENAIKKTFDKRFAIPLDFDFFKHSVDPYGLRKDLIVRLELNSSDKVSDISLEYDAIFDKPYATIIGEMYSVTTFILYTKVTSVYYQTLKKNALPGRLT